MQAKKKQTQTGQTHRIHAACGHSVEVDVATSHHDICPQCQALAAQRHQQVQLDPFYLTDETLGDCGETRPARPMRDFKPTFEVATE